MLIAHVSPARPVRPAVSLFNVDGTLTAHGMLAVEAANKRGLDIAKMSEDEALALIGAGRRPARIRAYSVETTVRPVALAEIRDDEPALNFVPASVQPVMVAVPTFVKPFAIEVDAAPASPTIEIEADGAVDVLWLEAGPPAPPESEVAVVETVPEPPATVVEIPVVEPVVETVPEPVVAAAPVHPARPAPAYGKYKDAEVVRPGSHFTPCVVVSRPKPKPVIAAAPAIKPWQKPAAPAVAQKQAKVQPQQPKPVRVNPQTALEAAFAQARLATPSMVQPAKGKGGTKSRNERKQAKGKAGK